MLRGFPRQLVGIAVARHRRLADAVAFASRYDAELSRGHPVDTKKELVQIWMTISVRRPSSTELQKWWSDPKLIVLLGRPYDELLMSGLAASASDGSLTIDAWWATVLSRQNRSAAGREHLRKVRESSTSMVLDSRRELGSRNPAPVNRHQRGPSK